MSTPSALRTFVGGLALLLGAGLAVTAMVPGGLVDPAAAEEAVVTPSGLEPVADVAAKLDAVIEARLEAEGVKPAPLCDDATYLRRISLDLRGTVPTPAEVEAFLADRSPDRRAKLVERFLADEAYAPYQAMWWYRTLTGVGLFAGRRGTGEGVRNLAGGNGEAFHDWLTEQIAANRPFDELAYELITAEGRTDENPAAVYIARWEGNPNNTIGAIAKHFLGVKIQCAQCHDHVYEDTWKQKDFQGMAAFVAPLTVRRVPEYRRLRELQEKVQIARQKAAGRSDDLGRPGRGDDAMDGGDAMDGDGAMDGAGAMDGDANQPPAQQPRGGRYRDAAGLSDAERQELRDLAKFRATVEVVDPPVDPRLAARRRPARENLPEALRDRLDLLAVTPKLWMAATLEDTPGVPRRMLLARWITGDEHGAFGRELANRMWGALLGRGFVDPVDDFNSFNDASHPEALDVLTADVRAAGYDLKRLTRVIVSTRAYQRASTWEGDLPAPELFARAQVRPLTTDQLPFALLRAAGLDGAAGRGARREGERLRELLARIFSFVFDDDEGAESEDFQGSIPQGLFLMNSQAIQRGLRAERGMPLQRLLASSRSDEERVKRLWLAVYGREPVAHEKKVALKAVRGPKDESDAYEDLFWALLNSAEFMSNH